jgi:aspartate dehydrogenase
MRMKVAVIGAGAIGGTVARAVLAGEVTGASLAGVVHADPVDPEGLPVIGAEQAVAEADLVVECAGQRALAEIGPRVLAAGRELLIASVGALADEALFAALARPARGRVHLCTGAVGGLDLLCAAALMGPLHEVVITTTKKASSLVQPWMDDTQARALREATAPVELMNGPAREVTAAFPRSANVAASVALAAGDWGVVRAVVVADPTATLTSHVITAAGAAGEYRFEIRNHPSPQTPTTSGVVPYSVLRSLHALTGREAAFR